MGAHNPKKTKEKKTKEKQKDQGNRSTKTKEKTDTQNTKEAKEKKNRARAASAGPKAKSAPADKSTSGNRMPRAASPQGKAVGKPAAKPPPKAITPLGKAAVAKPPPKAVTAKAPPSTADKAREDWEAARAKVAERQQQDHLAAPKSPPLFAVDWSRFTSREAFLNKTAEVYRLDPNSAGGYNHHVSSYYYVSTDWGVSHPQSYSSIMFKNDSRQSHRWTCVHCKPSHPEVADHKTVEEGMIHWWRNHCHPASWAWCDKATAFGITTAEVCKAVLGIDLSDQPLPLGGAFHILPNALPSHPKGLDERLFKHPYSKTLTPANHPSEVGLPWNAHLEQLAKEPPVELTSWGWEQFFGNVFGKFRNGRFVVKKLWTEQLTTRSLNPISPGATHSSVWQLGTVCNDLIEHATLCGNVNLSSNMLELCKNVLANSMLTPKYYKLKLI